MECVARRPGRSALLRVQPDSVFVGRLNKTIVDNGEVQSGRRIIRPCFSFRLLMHTAAVENGKQMGQFQNGDIAKGHGKHVVRQQADTVKPDLLPA
ncbi:hypothetical protein D3C87_1591100 [compost metagenome]